MEALRITDRLFDYLKNQNGRIAQIHSVFDGAFNIMDGDGQLIGILSSEKDLPPFGMIVNCRSFHDKSIIQGDLCEITSQSIHFQNSKLKIEVNQPEVVNLSITTLKGNHTAVLPQKIAVLKKMILTNGALGGIAELIKYLQFYDFTEMYKNISYKKIQSTDINEYSDFIKDRLLDLMNSILNENQDMFRSAIQKTIGFGPGLTPSTDDFLTGVIIMMNYLNQNIYHQMLTGIETLCVNKTTKISEEMINHALKGYGPESYKTFIQVMFDNKENDIVESVNNVIKIGSTSGTDFLFGVYCMAMINAEKLRRL